MTGLLIKLMITQHVTATRDQLINNQQLLWSISILGEVCLINKNRVGLSRSFQFQQREIFFVRWVIFC